MAIAVNPTALPREPRLYVLVSTGSRSNAAFQTSPSSRRRSPAGHLASSADILWTLNHPAVYGLLAGDRGWTPDRFERWLAGIFWSELLARR